jgi:uncharacterized phage-associated protein
LEEIEMSLQIYSAADIADFFRSRTVPEDNDLSNLKLQKLCYYAQGLATSMRGVPLFSDKICAWDHGPVIPNLYHEFKKYGGQPIPPLDDFDASKLDPRDLTVLDAINSYYGQFSAWRLRDMTHDERPWLDAYREGQSSEIILSSLIEFFRPQIDEEYVRELYGQGLAA